MNYVLWENLVKLIAEQIGFYIKAKDYPSLESKIETRIKALKLSNLGDYFNLLKDSIDSKLDNVSPQRMYRGNEEWKALANIITNGESFFFRDRGQFNLLQETLIPQLIEKKRNALDFNLKIWSSGCSTGQEPYSLAIVLDKIISDISQWNISVIGTDINQDFLKLARIGIYQNWSFRLTEPSLKKDYFTSSKKGWKINHNIRNLVTFYEDNIVQDKTIPIPCYGVDLILCRNVFIYFKKYSVAKGMDKFYSALNPGGYLMTGHAELQEIALNKFKILSFPESVIYQKPEVETIANTAPLFESIKINLDIDITSANTNSDFNSWDLDELDLKIDYPIQSQKVITQQDNNQQLEENNLVSELENLLAKEEYERVIEQGQRISEQQPDKHLIYYMMARAYTNQDNIFQAEIYCHKVLDIDSMFIPPLYLLAQIAENQNNLKKAKEFLKRIIYLDPFSVVAYVELGSVYTRDGDLTRATKMYNTAYNMLQDLPSDRTFDYGDIITVSELITRVKEKLS